MKLLPSLITCALLTPALLLADAPCTVEWDPSPGADTYRVYRGIELLATVLESQATVTLSTDHLSTLTVTAANAAGESEHSDSITVRPLVPQASRDLAAWESGHAFFVLDSPSLFLRFQTPGPTLPPSPLISDH